MFPFFPVIWQFMVISVVPCYFMQIKLKFMSYLIRFQQLAFFLTAIY